MDCILYAKELKEKRMQKNEELMRNGVIIEDPSSTYIDEEAKISAGAVILPNTRITGSSVIGKSVIGPNSIIESSRVGDDCEITASVLKEATVDNKVAIGPFAYLRPKTHICNNAKIGDFVEVKNSTVGAGTKVAHLTYIGDADVGEKCNFGCGTVIVNYDGKNKHRTTIGNNAFIGCNTNLVSPVEVGDYGYTAAGSTITENVPAGSLGIGRARQVNKGGWVEKSGKLKK